MSQQNFPERGITGQIIPGFSALSGLKSGWFIGAGIALLILGCVCAFYTLETTLASTMVVGIIMAIAGVVQVLQSFAHSPKSITAHIFSFLLGVCTFIAGLIICYEPVAGSIVITIFLSAMFIVGGIARLIWAFNYRNVPVWWIGALNGAVTLGIGVLLYISLPWSGLYFLGTLIAIELIFSAINLLAFGFGLKRMENRS